MSICGHRQTAIARGRTIINIAWDRLYLNRTIQYVFRKCTFCLDSLCNDRYLHTNHPHSSTAWDAATRCRWFVLHIRSGLIVNRFVGLNQASTNYFKVHKYSKAQSRRQIHATATVNGLPKVRPQLRLAVDYLGMYTLLMSRSSANTSML